MNNKQLFDVAHEVADFIFAQLAVRNKHRPDHDKLYMEDRRKESVNPFYNQMTQGLALEMYYGMPSRIWTPWGQWGFGGSGMGSFDAFVELLLPQLGGEVLVPLVANSMGEFGPTYGITKIGSMALPQPIVCAKRDEFMVYERARDIWQEMTDARRDSVG